MEMMCAGGWGLGLIQCDVDTDSASSQSINNPELVCVSQ